MRRLCLSAGIQFVAIALGFCQPPELKKSAVPPMEPIELNWFGGSGYWQYHIQERINGDGRKVATGTGRSRNTLEKEEYLVYSHAGAALKTRPLRMHKREFVKETNGKILQRMEIGMETLPIVIDSDGRFVIFDIVDGTATRGAFYSPEFKKISSYSPSFDYSFDPYIGYSDSIVCIGGQERGSKSSNCKLAILNHDGALITEKQLKLPDFNLSSVNVIANKVVVHTRRATARGARLICYDVKLNELWSTEMSYPVMVFASIKSSKNQTMLFATVEGVYCLDVLSGHELWKLSNNGSKSTFIEPMFILDDEYVVVASSTYESDEFRNGRLTLLSAKDGKVWKVEELGTSLKKLEIIPEENGFVLIQDANYIRYSR